MFLTTARISPLVAGFAFVMAAGTSAFAQNTVTACGQTVSSAATLANDLDCTGMTTAVTIRLGATLTLGGFSITGAPIHCDQNCTIQGPGTIDGVGGGSIVARSLTSNGDIVASKELTLVGSNVNGRVEGDDRAYVESSTVTGDGSLTVGIDGYILNMIDSTVTNHGLAGVYCGAGKIFGSTISNNARTGVNCGIFTIEDSEITGNGFAPDDNGIFTRVAVDGYIRARIIGTQITGNRNGVFAGHLISGGNVKGRIQMMDSLVDGNERTGVSSVRVSIKGSTVTNNGCLGASASKKLRFETTDITGNGTDVTCSTRADVFSYNTPVLREGATCETSLGNGTNYDESWDVCSLD